VRDALFFVPVRVFDLRAEVAAADLVPDVLCAIPVTSKRCRIVPARRRFLEVTLTGADGTPLIARWFTFRRAMAERFTPGARFLLVGTPRRHKRAGPLSFVHPQMAAPDEELPGSKAVYPDVAGVPGRTVARLCQEVCRQAAHLMDEPLSAEALQRLDLPPLPAALSALHLSPAPDDRARRRLVLAELISLQLGLLRRRAEQDRHEAPPCPAARSALAPLLAALPFVPTPAQERAISEIRRDLARPRPMQRLLCGDVGSGKTLVAYAACELAMQAGQQAALMAPTELLAEQHAHTLAPWAAATGRRLALLHASTPAAERARVLSGLASGAVDLVIGTHALLGEQVLPARLGLVVIDEQQRFGVAQRAALRDKGRGPHLLLLSATPIPRTLALCLYGDLDVSLLDERPPGRVPAETRLLSPQGGRDEAIASVRAQVAAGGQGYWVCPLIDESERLDLQSLAAAHDRLAAALPGHRVGLCHGRLPGPEREAVMRRFRDRDLDLLLCTTVVEVGVDVPGATIMVIEGAERFGLSQLHQLRGRVGRWPGARAECLLLPSPGLTPARRAVLEVLARERDGFRIAEEDLRLRGPGELLGTRQAGPLFAFDLLRDAALLEAARREAALLLARDPGAAAALAVAPAP
jgi:ATP-dependent DNA helicase RecG